MPRTRKPVDVAVENAAALESSDLRVDAAHAGPREESAAVASSAASAALVGSAAAEPTSASEGGRLIHQIRAQAAQLASHLQRQQATVDHREAELNARLANMENEIRSARLWLDERHAELSEKAAELERRERELDERATAIPRDPPQEQDKDMSSQLSSAQAAQLAERALELDHRQAELDALAARLADEHARASHSGADLRAERALEARRRRIEQAEKLLAGEYEEFERGRRQLAAEREEFARRVEAERRQMTEEAEQAATANAKARYETQRQADEIAARQEALELLHSEVTRSQKEVLEVRLATEELWVRLCGTMAPAALTQSLAQLRLKLAEEQRLACDELARRKLEVQELADQVAQRHQKLVNEREQLDAWINQRQKQIEQQASALVAAQRQIDLEQKRLSQASAQWLSERYSLQAEIRRLLVEQSRSTSAAA